VRWPGPGFRRRSGRRSTRASVADRLRSSAYRTGASGRAPLRVAHPGATGRTRCAVPAPESPPAVLGGGGLRLNSEALRPQCLAPTISKINVTIGTQTCSMSAQHATSSCDMVTELPHAGVRRGRAAAGRAGCRVGRRTAPPLPGPRRRCTLPVGRPPAQPTIPLLTMPDGELGGAGPAICPVKSERRDPRPPPGAGGRTGTRPGSLVAGHPVGHPVSCALSTTPPLCIVVGAARLRSSCRPHRLPEVMGPKTTLRLPPASSPNSRASRPSPGCRT